MSDCKELAKQVSLLRAMNGMTQSDLSKKSGLSLSEIHNIENGVKKPRATTLVKLAKALSVEPQELLNYVF